MKFHPRLPLLENTTISPSHRVDSLVAMRSERENQYPSISVFFLDTLRIGQQVCVVRLLARRARLRLRGMGGGPAVGVLRVRREDGGNAWEGAGGMTTRDPLGRLKDCMEHARFTVSLRSVRTYWASSTMRCSARRSPWSDIGSG